VFFELLDEKLISFTSCNKKLFKSSVNLILSVCNPFKIGFSGRRRVFYAGDDDEEELAESKEKRCNEQTLCGNDEYEVEIEPDVNCLLVFAVLIALDAMEEDKQQ